jgi:hypothetical protein
VKGDFRLFRIQGGFISCWREILVARDESGNFLWKKEGWGRCLAVSPDQTKIAAVSAKEICVFDAKTGKAMADIRRTKQFIDILVWIDNEKIIGTDSKNIYLFDNEGNETELFEGAVEIDGFIGGIVPDASNLNFVFILDINNYLIKKIDLQKRYLIKEKYCSHAEQLFFDANNNLFWATIVNGTKLEEIKNYDRRKFREKSGFTFEGKRGVRFANQSPNDLSLHSFVSLPSLSPKSQYFLVNDNSGLLWLLDAKTGDKRRIFKRNLLNYVYSTVWLDEEHFVAMLEDGYVAKMSIRGRELQFKKNDFEDDFLNY